MANTPVSCAPSGTGEPATSQSAAFIRQLVQLVGEERKQNLLETELENVDIQREELASSSVRIEHRIQVRNKRRKAQDALDATDESGRLYLDAQCDRKQDLGQEVSVLASQVKAGTLLMYTNLPAYVNDVLRAKLPALPAGIVSHLCRNKTRQERIEEQEADLSRQRQIVRESQLKVRNIVADLQTELDAYEAGADEDFLRILAGYLAAVLRHHRDLMLHAETTDAKLLDLSRIQKESESAILQHQALSGLADQTAVVEEGAEDGELVDLHRDELRVAYISAADTYEERREFLDTVFLRYEAFAATARIRDPLASRTEIDHSWHQYVARRTQEVAAAEHLLNGLAGPVKDAGLLTQTSGFGDVEGDGAVDTEISTAKRRRLASTDHAKVWHWVPSPVQCNRQRNSWLFRQPPPKDRCERPLRTVAYQDPDRFSFGSVSEVERDRLKKLVRKNNEQCDDIRKTLPVVDTSIVAYWRWIWHQ